FIFFFQAEDGIRDRNVTGVQTCALPIYTIAILLQTIPAIAILLPFCPSFLIFCRPRIAKISPTIAIIIPKKPKKRRKLQLSQELNQLSLYHLLLDFP